MSDVADRVTGLLHEPTQVHDGGVDLTAAEVYEVDEPGRVDFGGGELAAAAFTTHGTVKRDPGDDYGWWHLDDGQYLVEYNESLDGGGSGGGGPLVLQTRDAVRERGAFHPTLFVEQLGAVPLSVGGEGIRLKENARVSTLSDVP